MYLAQRYDESIEQYRRTLDMESNFVVARCMLGMAYERKSQTAEARSQFQQALAISPNSGFALARMGISYASSGDRNQAQQVLHELAELSKSRYVPSIYPSSVYNALGDADQAFAWTNKAVDERSHYLIYLDVDPSLGSFRADPRYPELARRIGLRR